LFLVGSHEKKRRRFHDISLEARAYESTHSFFEYTEEKESTECFSVNSVHEDVSKKITNNMISLPLYGCFLEN
jgi:hypothetical protein